MLRDRKHLTIYCSSNTVLYSLKKNHMDQAIFGKMAYSIRSIASLKDIYPSVKKMSVLLYPGYYLIHYFPATISDNVKNRKVLIAMLTQAGLNLPAEPLIEKIELDNGGLLAYVVNLPEIQQIYNDFFRVFGKSIALQPMESILLDMLSSQMNDRLNLVLYKSNNAVSLFYIDKKKIIGHEYLSFPVGANCFSDLLSTTLDENTLSVSWTNQIHGFLNSNGLSLSFDVWIISSPIDGMQALFNRLGVGDSLNFLYNDNVVKQDDFNSEDEIIYLLGG